MPTPLVLAEGPFPAKARTAWRGLLVRREVWLPSWKGLCAALVMLGGLAAAMFFSVQPFLAVTKPVPASLLVVEGWVHEPVIRTAADMFKRGDYVKILATGGPVAGDGGYSNDYNTAASVGAGRLRAAGVPAEKVMMVPCRELRRDRTYSSAMALGTWLKENEPGARSVNVLTEGPHARRTRLLFSKALGSSIRVGIISVRNPDYDARHWWRYSEGVRDVVGESIAYLYARFIFSPDARSSGDPRDARRN